MFMEHALKSDFSLFLRQQNLTGPSILNEFTEENVNVFSEESVHLNFSHTILSFNDPQKKAFGKPDIKRRNCW